MSEVTDLQVAVSEFCAFYEKMLIDEQGNYKDDDLEIFYQLYDQMQSLALICK